MNKLKKGFLLLMTFVYGSALLAQSIDDGKKFFFYERFQSAKKIFSQLVSSNPNNIDAVYWLGQSEIALDDSTTAKTLFQNTLMANPNSALLLVGIGQVELMEGKTQDARQRFETAISLSQGKSIPVLNAIGFANVNATNGDSYYAIDKLKQATTLKGFKDPDVYINLGDAYNKNLDGGSAQTAYENAMSLYNSAIPSYKIGNIYITQGPQQEEIFTKYYNDAIAKDPTFAPVYYQLYVYFYHRDVSKSKDYLDKYIANSDPDPKDCYYQASILYASALFQQSISKADECIATAGGNAYPNLFGLKAFAYDKLVDSANAKKIADNLVKDSVSAVTDSLNAISYSNNAKTFFEQYFAKQKPEKIGPTDYSTYAKDLLRSAGNDSLAGIYVDKAIALDTLEKDKLTDAKVMLNYYIQNKDPNQVGNWYKKIIWIRKQPFSGDYHSAGFNYYKAGNFPAAAATFDSATQKFPDDIYSYYMLGKSNWGIDTTMELGLANPAFQKVIDLGQADTVKNKTYIMGSYKYFIGYNVNVKKDKATALDYCDKALALDPADAEAANYKNMISKLKIKPSTDKKP